MNKSRFFWFATLSAYTYGYIFSRDVNVIKVIALIAMPVAIMWAAENLVDDDSTFWPKGRSFDADQVERDRVLFEAIWAGAAV
jgi:hypothetical protein